MIIQQEKEEEKRRQDPKNQLTLDAESLMSDLLDMNEAKSASNSRRNSIRRRGSLIPELDNVDDKDLNYPDVPINFKSGEPLSNSDEEGEENLEAKLIAEQLLGKKDKKHKSKGKKHKKEKKKRSKSRRGSNSEEN